MGFIEPMAIVSAVPSVVIPIGSPLAVWALTVSLLAISTLGIALSLRRPRLYLGLHLVRTAEAS